MTRSRMPLATIPGVLCLCLLAGSAVGEELKVSGSEERAISLESTSFFSPWVRWQDNGESVATLFQGGLNRMATGGIGPLGEFSIYSGFVGTDLFLGAELSGVVLSSENPSQRYLVDSDNNNALSNHIWYENTLAGSDRMMQLTEANGGDLLLAGTLTENHAFDLAESFWESEPIVPGELVVIDPADPDAVRRSSGPYEKALLGVASTRPGIVLGGGAFSLEELRDIWGGPIAENYLAQRPALELLAFERNPELREEAAHVANIGSFAAAARRRALTALAQAESEGRLLPGLETEPSAEATQIAYEAALRDHEMTLFDATVRLFFEKSFTRVALAGRVPVKVDASFGPIEPGDYLTSSPVPGVAMKASRPGPAVGMALEGLASGTGLIKMFVDRQGWGHGGRLIGAQRGETQNSEVAELESRLAALEGLLRRTITREAMTASAGVRSQPDPLAASD